MFSDFLDFDTTYKSEIRDFPEWHKGVKYFGFWAIEVRNSTCLDKIKIHQDHLKDKLHTNYSRQPHITLFASGLLCDNYFHKDLIEKQIKQIKKSNIKSFSLQLSSCNSFSTCPYLTIIDSSKNLDFIRKCLNNTSTENNPAIYTPHITLGFYNNTYKTSDIVKNILEINSSDIEFKVSEIVFAQYETKDIQGPYEVLHRIKLDDSV